MAYLEYNPLFIGWVFVLRQSIFFKILFTAVLKTDFAVNFEKFLTIKSITL